MRTILHSDINACYASIEHLHHPELAGKPLAVGGDPEARHGIVLTADYQAKRMGVKTGMALWQARQVCPQIIFVPPRMDLYLRFSKMAQEIYSEYPDFYDIVKELIDFGISRYHANFSERYQNTDFVLFQKYTYEDVCRLLNWESNEVPLNIGGYKFDRKTRMLPVFINYFKAEDISDTTKYEDHFVDSGTLIAISKSGRSVDSEDVQNFLHARERGIDVHLLVRKNKDDKISKEFYYLGRMYATGQKQEFQMPNTTKTAVEIEWKLDTPVREDIYQYIIG